MYNRGTLEEFNTWHESVKVLENIPPEGKIGYVNGEPSPETERTYNYSAAMQNPDLSDDYVWLHGDYPIPGKPVLSQNCFHLLGWVDATA